MLRKASTTPTPVTEVSEERGDWTVKTSTTLKTVELRFKLGEELSEKTPDGHNVKAKVAFKDGKIVTVQKAKRDKEKNTLYDHIAASIVTAFTDYASNAKQIRKIKENKRKKNKKEAVLRHAMAR